MCSVLLTNSYCCKSGGGNRGLRKEKDQLTQERARILENERKVGEELKTGNQELTGKICFNATSVNSFIFIDWY
jgi:hypothetical protein